jgi:hypothetical protein
MECGKELKMCPVLQGAPQVGAVVRGAKYMGVKPLEGFCPCCDVGVSKRIVEDFRICLGSLGGMFASAVGFECWGREIE